MHSEGMLLINLIKGVRARCSPVRQTGVDPRCCLLIVKGRESHGRSLAGAMRDSDTLQDSAGCWEWGRGWSCRRQRSERPGQDAALPKGRKRTEQRSWRGPQRWLLSAEGLSMLWDAQQSEQPGGGKAAPETSNNPGNHDQNLHSDNGTGTRDHNFKTDSNEIVCLYGALEKKDVACNYRRCQE